MDIEIPIYKQLLPVISVKDINIHVCINNELIYSKMYTSIEIMKSCILSFCDSIKDIIKHVEDDIKYVDALMDFIDYKITAMVYVMEEVTIGQHYFHGNSYIILKYNDICILLNRCYDPTISNLHIFVKDTLVYNSEITDDIDKNIIMLISILKNVFKNELV